jgi:mono/diheme cytochrome c family protein
VEYGEYIAQIAACRECHGNDLAGGTNQGAPIGPNLTPGGAFAAYREEDFLTVFHTGVTPGGRTLSEEMPWMNYGKMTDDELKALFMYLQSVPPLPNAGT